MIRFKNMFHMSLVMAILATLPCTATVFGQEAEQPVEGVQRSVIVMSGSSAEGNVIQIETPMAAPLRLAPALGVNAYSFSPFGGAGTWSNSIGWLNDQNILDELDIIEEQQAQLQKIRDEVTQKRSDFYKSFRDVETSKRGEFMREFGELLQSDIDKKVAEVLLPHQKKRLEQVQLQTRMRNMGIQGMGRDILMKELGITDEQMEQLRKKQKEVQEELRKKLEELRREAQEEVISVLPEPQQKKIREMMGEVYEFKPRKFVPPPSTQRGPEKKK